MTVNIDSIGLDFFPPVCKQTSEVFVTPPRIMLADDHTILLEAFRKLLEPRFEIVGMVSDGRALLDAAPSLKPDVIVVDVGMPLMNGLEAGLRLKEMMPSAKIIFLTMNDDPDLAVNAMRSGASAYLLKRSAASELIHAIQLSLKGKSYVTPQIARGMEKAFINNPNPKDRAKALTPRQREVVQLLAEGKSMKEVASVLNVTPRTVAFHKYRVMEELNLQSTAELVQFAMKSRILVT
jgi:DNA-binding NarL/FixJ family response regulator